MISGLLLLDPLHQVVRTPPTMSVLIGRFAAPVLHEGVLAEVDGLGTVLACSTTASTVGRMCQINEVTTCCGASSCWSTIIPITGMSLLGRGDDAVPLGEEHVGAGRDVRVGGLLGGGGVEEGVDERDLHRGLRVGLLHALDEAR